ncbi:MAG: hypothetical protein ACR2PR_09320 [Pseudohongiellaceae bacterium]
MQDAVFAAACLNQGEGISHFIKADTVACAAWKSKDGKTTYYGLRHGDCYKEAVKRNGGTGYTYPTTAPPENQPGEHPDNQGFALADGSFASRKEAATIAFAAGQITGAGLSPTHKEQTERNVKVGKYTDHLTSEELY